MAQKEQCLFIGIGSHVVAIRPSDGQEVWRRKLRSTGTFITLYVVGDVVYAGSGGELYCLDGLTGEIRWHNRLKGLGTSLVSFGGASTVEAAAAMAAAAAAVATAAAAAAVATAAST